MIAFSFSRGAFLAMVLLLLMAMIVAFLTGWVVGVSRTPTHGVIPMAPASTQSRAAPSQDPSQARASSSPSSAARAAGAPSLSRRDASPPSPHQTSPAGSPAMPQAPAALPAATAEAAEVPPQAGGQDPPPPAAQSPAPPQPAAQAPVPPQPAATVAKTDTDPPPPPPSSAPRLLAKAMDAPVPLFKPEDPGPSGGGEAVPVPPAPASAPSQANPPAGKPVAVEQPAYTLQVGQFDLADPARALYARLKAKRYDAYVVTVGAPTPLMVVRIGVFDNRAAALQAASAVRIAEGLPAEVVRIDPASAPVLKTAAPAKAALAAPSGAAGAAPSVPFN